MDEGGTPIDFNRLVTVSEAVKYVSRLLTSHYNLKVESVALELVLKIIVNSQETGNLTIIQYLNLVSSVYKSGKLQKILFELNRTGVLDLQISAKSSSPEIWADG